MEPLNIITIIIINIIIIRLSGRLLIFRSMDCLSFIHFVCMFFFVLYYLLHCILLFYFWAHVCVFFFYRCVRHYFVSIINKQIKIIKIQRADTTSMPP